MITSDPSVITRAADMGINFFDTSRGYQQGNNERMVGAALEGKRKDVILSSQGDGSTKEAALAELETSLKELGTDHLDIWHLHSKNSPESITDELADAQETAKKQGKTRFIGVSTHRAGGDRRRRGQGRQAGRGTGHLQLHRGRRHGGRYRNRCTRPGWAWWP